MIYNSAVKKVENPRKCKLLNDVKMWYQRRKAIPARAAYVLAKEIMSLLSLQLMYSYLNESALYAGVLNMH